MSLCRIEIISWCLSDMFKCDKCGECCRHLDRSSIYKPLDRGDGICKYLIGNECSIYKDRPLICRVDDSYDKFFSEQYSLEEYYRLNKEACKIIKKM